MRIRNPLLLPLFLIALALNGCGQSSVPAFPPQTWEDIQVVIETRPPVPEKGMNEFLVIANNTRGGPVANLVISLKVNEDGRWHQAIQDGHVGVYRRAVPVTDPATDTLIVRLERDSREGMLRFALNTQGQRQEARQ